MARHDAEARRQVAVEGDLALALGQQHRVEEEGQVVQDGVARRDAQVVRPARARQVDRHVVHEAVVAVDDAHVHVGRLLGIVEEHHLAGGGVDLVVRGHAVGHAPGPVGVGAQGLERDGVEPPGLAALGHRGQQLAGVDLDVGAGVVLHRADRAPAAARAELRRQHPGPQRAARGLLGQEARGLHEAVAVGRAPVLEVHRVQHAVAVEGVVHPDRLVHLVVRVAHVDAGQVARDLADHLHAGGVGHVLVHGRGEGAVQEGVVVVGGEGRAVAAQDLLHGVLLRAGADDGCVVRFFGLRGGGARGRPGPRAATVPPVETRGLPARASPET